MPKKYRCFSVAVWWAIWFIFKICYANQGTSLKIRLFRFPEITSCLELISLRDQISVYSEATSDVLMYSCYQMFSVCHKHVFLSVNYFFCMKNMPSCVIINQKSWTGFQHKKKEYTQDTHELVFKFYVCDHNLSACFPWNIS